MADLRKRSTVPLLRSPTRIQSCAALDLLVHALPSLRFQPTGTYQRDFAASRSAREIEFEESCGAMLRAQEKGHISVFEQLACCRSYIFERDDGFREFRCRTKHRTVYILCPCVRLLLPSHEIWTLGHCGCTSHQAFDRRHHRPLLYMLVDHALQSFRGRLHDHGRPS
jgi:hypothetical protein